MPSITQATGRRPYWNSGRAFASLDPERQGEVIGYVRSNSSVLPPTTRLAAMPPARRDWTRVQPDVESSFEGSSSRRGR